MHNLPHPGGVLCEWLADITVKAAKRLGVTSIVLSRVLSGETEYRYRNGHSSVQSARYDAGHLGRMQTI